MYQFGCSIRLSVEKIFGQTTLDFKIYRTT